MKLSISAKHYNNTQQSTNFTLGCCRSKTPRNTLNQHTNTWYLLILKVSTFQKKRKI